MAVFGTEGLGVGVAAWGGGASVVRMVSSPVSAGVSFDWIVAILVKLTPPPMLLSTVVWNVTEPLAERVAKVQVSVRLLGS